MNLILEKTPECLIKDMAQNQGKGLKIKRDGKGLRLEKNHLSDEGRAKIEQAFSNNNSLVDLCIPKSILNDDVVPGLCELLHRNTVLREFSLDESIFHTDGMIAVLGALNRNHSLTNLSLRASRLTDKVVPSLLELLTNNAKLRALQLPNSTFSDAAVVELLRALSSNRTLQGLRSVSTLLGPHDVFMQLCLWQSILTDKVIPALVGCISKNQTLTSLQFHQSRFSDEAMSKLLCALGTNTSLQSLSLCQSILTDEVIPAMVDCISNNQTLTALQFHHSKFSDEAMSKLLCALGTNTSLQSVSLRQSILTDEAIPTLVDCISNNKTLRELQLNQSKFSDDAMSKLLCALGTNTSLQSVSLWQSILTDEVIPALVDCISNNKTLRELQLNQSKFSDDAMSKLLCALGTNTSLQSVSLWQSILTDEVIPALVDCISNNKTLRELQLNQSKFSDDAMSKLLCALGTNTSLQYLSLCDSKLTDRVMPTLVKFVSTNSTLKALQLYKSDLSDDGMKRLLQVLTKDTLLQALSVWEAKLTDKDVPTVCEFVSNNRALQYLLIYGGEFTNDGIERLLHSLSQQHVLELFRIDDGSQLTDTVIPAVCDFLDRNQHKKSLYLRPHLHDNDVAQILGGFINLEETFSLTGKLESEKGTWGQLEKRLLDGDNVDLFSDSGISSASRMSEDIDFADLLDDVYQLDMQENQFGEPSVSERGKLPATKVPKREVSLEQDAGFGDNVELDETTKSSSEQQSLQERFCGIQLTARDNLPALPEIEGQQSSDSKSPTSEDGEGGFLDFPSNKKAAGLFFGETGGILQIPGSDVILNVPPEAVPKGKVYVIHGEIHTNVNEYNPWMASDDEYIISPVVEYRTESNEMFDQPVEIKIPHYLHPDKTDNIHVLCGSGDEYIELLKTDTDTKFSVEPHFVHIWTKHFTKFIVTKTGRVEEIGDLLLTVAAKQMETRTKSVKCLRLMIHTGLTMLNDFAEQRKLYYDKSMEEIVTSKIVLRESEEAIPVPDVNVRVNVTDSCDALIKFGDTPKQTQVRVDGKDVLRLPYPSQNRSETLADVIFEDGLNSQLDCSLEVIFEYSDDIKPVVNQLLIVYPEKCQADEESHQERWESVGNLTYEIMINCIKVHRPMIYQRLIVSTMLLAKLVAADVLGPSETDKLDVEGKTKHQKIDIILNTVVQKDVKTFLNFCLVLDHPKIQQSHVVTEVMNLKMDYIHAQRALYEPLEQPSISAAASPSTSSHPGYLEPSHPTKATIRKPAQSLRKEAAAPYSTSRSGTPRRARPRTTTHGKHSSVSEKKKH